MSISHQPDRKDLRIEGQFLPDDLGDLIDLRERVIDVIAAGEVDGVKPRMSIATANSLIGWLVAKATGAPDTISPNARSSYRKVLAALEAQPSGGGERGMATLRMATSHAAASGVVAAAVATGRPALLLLAPIIYEEPDSGGYVRELVA